MLKPVKRHPVLLAFFMGGMFPASLEHPQNATVRNVVEERAKKREKERRQEEKEKKKERRSKRRRRTFNSHCQVPV